MGILEGEGREITSEVIISLKLMSDNKSQIQEVQRISGKINIKKKEKKKKNSPKNKQTKTTPRHTIFRLQKNQR